MHYSQQEKAVIWLSARVRTDDRTRAALLRAADDPARLLFDFKKICAAVIKDGANRVYISGTLSPAEEAEALTDELERRGCFAVTPLSDDYPAPLAAISDPPLLLYGMGDRALLGRRKFCVVGSRRLPAWAERQTGLMAEELSRHFAVVTGFAEGGDRAAAAGALKNENVICVLPNGLDVCYPAAHASLKERVAAHGLLLSEYAFGERAAKYTFYARNRLLAGLCEGVLVTAAGSKSGALITAARALEYGRDVFAFPHQPGTLQGVGCNELIKSGAALVTEAQDILSAYGILGEERPRVALTAREERVLDVLRAEGCLHTAIVAERAGLAVFEAAAALSSLEIKNLVVKSGGNRYSAV